MSAVAWDATGPEADGRARTRHCQAGARRHSERPPDQDLGQVQGQVRGKAIQGERAHLLWIATSPRRLAMTCRPTMAGARKAVLAQVRCGGGLFLLHIPGTAFTHLGLRRGPLVSANCERVGERAAVRSSRPSPDLSP